MQEQIADVITRLKALLAQEGLDAGTASELRYRVRQLELAADQLDRGDDREEAYGFLCDALLALAQDGVLAHTPLPPGYSTPRPVPLTPELLEWARRERNEEEIAAGLREVQETGGLELKDFLPNSNEQPVPMDESSSLVPYHVAYSQRVRAGLQALVTARPPPTPLAA